MAENELGNTQIQRQYQGKLDDMGSRTRTKYCGQIGLEDVGSTVTVMGWANRCRDLGEIIFIDVRDRTGVVQVVCDSGKSPAGFAKAEVIRTEYVLAVTGPVVRREEGKENPNIATGDVEIVAEEVLILNTAKTPPIYIAEETEADELLRLKYRYLDIRRPSMLKNLELRFKVTGAIRDYMDSMGFWEIETPMMTRSTPEGARDYLVPFRLDKGKFYVLAQAPQLFKQLLMVGGIDKYFQLCRCFRDEDLRADRQPEFTQLDIEMSFVDEEDIYALVEGLMRNLWKNVLGKEVITPIPRLTYQEAMERYGSDKPDTRFGMEIKDLTESLKGTSFAVFGNVIRSGGTVRAIVLPGQGEVSRQETDALIERAKALGAKGLVPVAYLLSGEIKCPVKRHLSQQDMDGILSASGANKGDLVLIGAGEFEDTVEMLGRLRLEAGAKLGLIPENKSNFVWITEFPLFKINKDTGRWESAHHPFTRPFEADMEGFIKGELDSKGQIRAKLYDLVLNGVELASGSIRIHRRDMQEKVFDLLDMTMEEAREKFGFLLEAFEYGAPPHGGIAFGFDRLVMLMAGERTIRDIIAFPKTAKGTCPLTDAPSSVQKEQLEELGITLIKRKQPGKT